MPKKKSKKDDLSMVPPAVRKQAKKADDLLKGEGDPPADPVAPLKPTHPEPEDPGQQPAAPVEPNPEPVAPVINDPTAPASEDFRHKYSVLKGKYDADMARLNAQLASMQTVIETLQSVAETRATAAPSQSPGFEGAKKLNPDDYVGYGEEVQEMVKVVNALAAENEQLKGALSDTPPQSGGVDEDRINRLEGMVAQNAMTDYYSFLDREIPGWREINVSAKFVDWVNKPDPISLYNRVDILQHAAANYNAQQVANIFKAYINEVQGSATADPSQNALAGREVPGTSEGVENPENPGSPPKQYATVEQFKKAQKDFVAKRITEQEFNEISRQYQLAIREGKA